MRVWWTRNERVFRERNFAALVPGDNPPWGISAIRKGDDSPQQESQGNQNRKAQTSSEVTKPLGDPKRKIPLMTGAGGSFMLMAMLIRFFLRRPRGA